MEKAIVVFTNVPNSDVAAVMARVLIDRNLAACVNILPPVQSIYRWQGNIEEAEEITLLIKSSHEVYSKLEEAIVELHPYDLPEIIALPVVGGLPAYLAWIEIETQHNK